MQRFRQPQKMQGPLFPIEDNELIDAINDYKNIPLENTANNSEDEDYKPDITFDAENQIEVIVVDEIDMEINEDTGEVESETLNVRDDKENVSKNIKKEKDATVNMFCTYNYFKTYIFHFITIFFYFRLYIL